MDLRSVLLSNIETLKAQSNEYRHKYHKTEDAITKYKHMVEMLDMLDMSDDSRVICAHVQMQKTKYEVDNHDIMSCLTCVDTVGTKHMGAGQVILPLDQVFPLERPDNVTWR